MRYFLAAAVLFAAACKKDEIQVYKVAKPAEAPAEAHGPHDGHDHGPAGMPEGHPPVGAGMGMGQASPDMNAAATASPNSLAWKAPAGWSEKPASGMRRATFAVPGSAGPADLSVISLPGDAGGDLANVNRWRGQVGLPPWDQAAFKKAAETVSSPAGNFTVVDLDGASGRMLAAMTTRGGETWFFKLLGPSATVAGAKPAFKAFLSGVKPAG